ncbi:MAG: hypothetical protein J5944_14875 [Lentisphaeria bacterium]|nr:hypothetical protein [Lentisphaeria bacterium]
MTGFASRKHALLIKKRDKPTPDAAHPAQEKGYYDRFACVFPLQLAASMPAVTV